MFIVPHQWTEVCRDDYHGEYWWICDLCRSELFSKCGADIREPPTPRTKILNRHPGSATSSFLSCEEVILNTVHEIHGS